MVDAGEVKKISREGRALIQAYEKMAHEACAAIFWGDPVTGNVTDQGTVVFVNLGTQTIGLTAAHVAEGLQTFIMKGGRACRLGQANFFPPPPFVRHPDPEVDLAAFHFDSHFISTVGVKPVSIVEWPPTSPTAGEVMILGGFLGSTRVERDTELDVSFLFYAGFVDGNSGKKIRILLDIQNSNPLTRTDLEPGSRLGGCSGGPVFRCIDRAGIERLELAGIISEGVDSFELFYAESIESLTPAGIFE